jgi:murein DD-endopeptidase MepM/ murein hydrolase activator NlpD
MLWLYLKRVASSPVWSALYHGGPIRSPAYGRLGTLLVIALFLLAKPVNGQSGDLDLQVYPGDTWQALAWRFDLAPELLQLHNPHPNLQHQPAIGSIVHIPAEHAQERNGWLFRLNAGGLLGLAAETSANPWSLALANDATHPYRPLLYRPIFVAGGESPPRELPMGFRNLEVSAQVPQPGQALALRVQLQRPAAVEATLAGLPVATFANQLNLIGLVGTGAFFPPGEHELAIGLAGQPLWAQPWLFAVGEWTFQQITLTGEAAAIDQESIRQERERLFAVWSQNTARPMWKSSFEPPIRDYLETSSLYGARRSYNGGPYQTYHEGVDYSAYGGTPVYAPASGKVVLAERLFVRGGAVIIDHGLGVYTGFYHMSEVIALPGQEVNAGDLIGRVGSTGLSTGNHLHWDLLVSGTWVDAVAWLDADLACWILAGWGESCAPAPQASLVSTR